MIENKHVRRKKKRRRNKERTFNRQIRSFREAIQKADNIDNETKIIALEKISNFSIIPILLGTYNCKKSLKIPSLGIKISKEGVENLKETKAKALENSAGKMAVAFLNKHLDEGKTITIPSLGIVFSKKGGAKIVK